MLGSDGVEYSHYLKEIKKRKNGKVNNKKYMERGSSNRNDYYALLITPKCHQDNSCIPGSFNPIIHSEFCHGSRSRMDHPVPRIYISHPESICGYLSFASFFYGCYFLSQVWLLFFSYVILLDWNLLHSTLNSSSAPASLLLCYSAVLLNSFLLLVLNTVSSSTDIFSGRCNFHQNVIKSILIIPFIPLSPHTLRIVSSSSIYNP